MKIVIDIPNKDIPKYEEVIDVPFHFIDGNVCRVGGYGFVELSKGHGRLIDESDLIPDSDYDDGMFYAVSIGAINNTPTIIEADKGESEE